MPQFGTIRPPQPRHRLAASRFPGARQGRRGHGHHLGRKKVNTAKAELVTPYPPGIPAVAPGEVLTVEIVGYLEEVVALGGLVEAATDQRLDTFAVVSSG